MPYREDGILILAPGSFTTKIMYGLSESFIPPSHSVPTRVYLNENNVYSLHGEKPIYPILKGEIVNMEALLAFLQILIRKSTKKSHTPVALVVGFGWGNRDKQLVAKMLFEKCEIGGLALIDDTLCGLHAFGRTEGIVINVGHEKTEIAAYFDSILQSNAVVPVGSKAISNHLQSLLPNLTEEQIEELKNSNIVEILTSPILETDEDATVDVAKIVARGKTKEFLEKSQVDGGDAPDNALLETNSFDYNGESIAVGKERFKAGQVLIEDIVEGYGLVLSQIDYEKRGIVKENLIIVGGGAKIKGWREMMTVRLQEKYSTAFSIASALPTRYNTPSVTGSSTPALNYISSSSSGTMRLAKLPDYFIEWKDVRQEDAGFLGAQISARTIFVTDSASRGYTAREDYIEDGPSAVTAF